MKKVAILVHSDIALFELGCATELFALPRPEFDCWYDTQIISFRSEPANCLAGLTLKCDSVSDLKGFDILVIPSWPSSKASIDNDIAKSIHAFAAQGGQLLSFCSGAFLLGYLGLLDNRNATTHWRYENQFKKAFPYCHYQPNVLYVLENDIGCSAGSAAAIDLGLAVIRNDFGNEIANSVARRLVLSGHRKGGQAQFVEAPVAQQTNKLGYVMDWAIENLSTAFSINELAKHASMSRRNFDRTFRQQTGQSPQEWLMSQRTMLACRLLETHDLTIEQIATHSGFSTAGNLRHHFHKQLAITPRQYRDNFQG